MKLYNKLGGGVSEVFCVQFRDGIYQINMQQQEMGQKKYILTALM
jgi:hypothetical protein